MCAGWLLASNGDMGRCWLGADQQWRHGVCLLGAGKQMKTWVCAGLVLVNNGDMNACLLAADQQWRHERVFGVC